MKVPLRSWLLGIATPAILKRVGLWMVIVGLIGEAAVVLFIPSGALEKTLTITFTLIIALGVWVEEVGSDELENNEKSETDLKLAEFAKRAAEANARALEAQVELAKYRAGRALRPEQIEKLAAGLRSSPKGPVIVKPNFLSPEPTRYANAISGIFNKSGFSDVGDKPLNIVSYNAPGLYLATRDRSPPSHFEGILRAFQSADIPIIVGQGDWVPDDATVVIMVSEQP